MRFLNLDDDVAVRYAMAVLDVPKRDLALRKGAGGCAPSIENKIMVNRGVKNRYLRWIGDVLG